jgi:hypothetical protein
VALDVADRPDRGDELGPVERLPDPVERPDEPDDAGDRDGVLAPAEPRVAGPVVRLLAVCFLDGPQVVTRCDPRVWWRS